jgi:hypothetical protein
MFIKNIYTKKYNYKYFVHIFPAIIYDIIKNKTIKFYIGDKNNIYKNTQ